ncbi:RICIN domain-containing protein [Nonomuraea sp. NPDC049400]|uniref:RICIN domain-containing protein n=1 Tax=Nonomuraea sp. NPDC049400 TaxID=3364352 RepID=UPI0037B208E0
MNRSSTLSRSESRAAARPERSWAHWSPAYNPGRRRTSRARSDPERRVPFATWSCRRGQRQPGRPRTIAPVEQGPRKPTPRQPSRSLRSVGDPFQYVNQVLTQASSCTQEPLPHRTVPDPAANKCLDVTGNSSADGTRLQIWTCTGAANQKWTLS